MKKLLFFAALSAAGAAVALTAVLAPGCADSCEDLAALCGHCGDADFAETCRARVNEDNQDVCSAAVAQFTTVCNEDEGAGGGGASSGGCDNGLVLCSGSCVDVMADAAFCGSCVTFCENQLCAAGVCVDTCPTGLPNQCGTGCVDTQTDPQNCGACDNACDTGQVCQAGVCGDGCDPAGPTPTECAGSCVTLASDLLNCGACGNACQPGEVCSAGQCADNCGDGLTECCGKCANTVADPGNCGGCDPSCPEVAQGTAGAGQVCMDMEVCLQGQCAPDCGSLTECAGGFCVDTNTDPNHCGMCNNFCPLGTVCNNGACGNSGCAPGFTDCAGSCFNLQENPQNCGVCGTQCSGTQPVCDHGTCAAACTSLGGITFTECDGSCVDTQSNADHCGGCGNACTAGQVCGNGMCQSNCPAGLTPCNGACVNTNSNFDHCGSCGNTCNDHSICTSDSCGGGTCANDSGALVCNDGNQCTQDLCDPVMGCNSVDVTQGQINALCPPPPPGQCLFCDPMGLTCANAILDDNKSCTVDTCPDGVKHTTDPPINVPTNTNCDPMSCAIVCNPADGNADPLTGCVQNNALCPRTCAGVCDISDTANIDSHGCVKVNGAAGGCNTTCASVCNPDDMNADATTGCVENDGLCLGFLCYNGCDPQNPAAVGPTGCVENDAACPVATPICDPDDADHLPNGCCDAADCN